MAYEGGDWCYLSSAPCTLLDGYEADATWTWAECEWNGQKQVDCGESEKAVASPRADESLAMSKSSHSVGPSKVVQALALVGFLTSLYGAACHFLKN